MIVWIISVLGWYSIVANVYQKLISICYQVNATHPRFSPLYLLLFDKFCCCRSISLVGERPVREKWITQQRKTNILIPARWTPGFSVSSFLSACLSIYLSVFLSAGRLPSVSCLSVCLSVSLSVCLSVSLAGWLIACSVCLSVCLSSACFLTGLSERTLKAETKSNDANLSYRCTVSSWHHSWILHYKHKCNPSWCFDIVHLCTRPSSSQRYSHIHPHLKKWHKNQNTVSFLG